MATIAERLESIWGERAGLAAWLTTVDHKRIGLRYLVTGLVFFAAGGVEALVMRVQLARADLQILNPQLYNQLFTMHGTTMMFLFGIPTLSGFGNYLVPLMIGTRDMAFPRLNAFGYWVFLAAGLFLYSSFAAGRAPDTGWFNYVPLADERFSPGLNTDFYTTGLLFLGISTTTGVINFIVTILKMRAPGMSINRMPIFVWGELAMALATLFALPPLTVAVGMLTLQRRFGFHFFDTAGGGDPLLWQHLFWIWGHPLVYIIVLPALGMVSAIIPTFSRRRMLGYTFIVVSEMAIALIGFGVWTHHMFAVGLPQLSLSFISAASFLITIPSGTQIFAWLATMIAGRPVLRTPMLFVLGFIVVFVIGGLSGVMFASVPFDQATHDTYFVVAHLHYVLFGGAVFPIFGALYYWLPKMTGRLLSERLGTVSFWAIFVGFNLTFFPMHTLGLLGQPRRTYTYQAGLGWESHNFISTIGAFVMALGILVTAYNWVRSMGRGEQAGNDPWGGETLEWATTSPPPHYNFEAIPTVTSKEPMWDQPELRAGAQPPEKGGIALTGGHQTLSTSMLDAIPQAVASMPHASPWPLLLTLALLVFFGGLLLGVAWMMIAGMAGIAVGVVGWFRPQGQAPQA